MSSSGTRSGRREPGWLWVVGLCFAAWCAVYIWRTSFVVEGERVFSLFDDEMISMRYARNLAGGHGLTWNPGEAPVEGFSNPLWVLFMTGLHLLPVAASKVSLAVQIAGAVLLGLNILLVYRLTAALTGGLGPVARAAALVTAAYLPLNAWGLVGAEVSLATVAVTGAAVLAQAAERDGRFPRGVYWILGAATLVRPDIAVLLLAAGLFLGAGDRPRRLRHLAWTAAALAIFVGSQTLFRMYYFGDLLPNTYYLKLTGYPVALRLIRGALVTADSVLQIGLLLLLAPLALVSVRRDRALGFMASLVGAQLAYNVWIGGDAWEDRGGANRFLAIVIPLVFVLLASAAKECLDRLAGKLTRRARLAAIVATMAAIVQANWMGSARGFQEWALVEPSPLVAGNRIAVERALLVRDVTTPNARVAVVWAGSIPYFAERSSVDLLGKNDRRIARGRAQTEATGRARLAAFSPGHMKWDFDYSIGDLRPDVVAELWKPDEARRNLEGKYLEWRTGVHVLYLRKDSADIDWPAVRARGTLRPVE